MSAFEMVHQDRVAGKLVCFDRLIFKGHVTRFYPAGGFKAFLDREGVLLKEYGRYVAARTAELKAHAKAMAESDGRREGSCALGSAGHLGVVLEGASYAHPAEGQGAGTVLAGVEGVPPSVRDEPADLVQALDGGAELGCEFLRGAHAAGAGESSSRGWAPGAPAEVTFTRWRSKASASASNSTRSK